MPRSWSAEATAHTPESATSATAVTSATPATPELDAWWQTWGDATLSRLVESALHANTDLGQSQANVRRARALRAAAASALTPVAEAALERQRGSPSGGPATTTRLFTASLAASWDLDVWGGTAAALRAAQADARAVEFGLAVTRRALATEVALDYVQWLVAQARWRVALENLSAQEDTLQLVRWREQAGLATGLEAAQAQSAVAQTRAQLPALRNSIAQWTHALSVLQGVSPTETVVTSADASVAWAALSSWRPTPLALNLPAAVLRRRPDVRMAEAQWVAGAERLAQAQAARYPQPSLRASTAWTGLTLSSLGQAAAVSAWGAVLSGTLYDGGFRTAQAQAQAEAAQALLEAYRGRVLTALQEVEDAIAARAHAQQRTQDLQAAEQAAGLAAEWARQRYANGLVDFQVVLEAQRTRLAIQDTHLVSQADALVQHIRLTQALGGGWSAPP